MPNWNWSGRAPWRNRNQSPPLFNNTNRDRDPNAYDDPNIPPNVPGQPPGVIYTDPQQVPINPDVSGPIDPRIPPETPYQQPPQRQFNKFGFNPGILIIAIIMIIVVAAVVLLASTQLFHSAN